MIIVRATKQSNGGQIFGGGGRSVSDVEAGVVDDEPVAPDGSATTDESVSDGR